MYDKVKSTQQDVYTILCSRRLGKSYMLCALASEICISTPGAIVKYACPKQKMVKTIIKPIMRQIFEDCPKELQPEFKTNDNLYEFPNGSQIQLAGTDNGNAESLRGGFSHLWIVDEAGFCSDLSYVVDSILSPTTDTTNGYGILASTPSRHSEHEFLKNFVEKHEEEGTLLKYTVFDNPMMTPEKIKKIVKRYVGGEKNPEFRREYLCEVVPDDDDMVFSEFTAEAQQEIIKDYSRPAFFDGYVSLDIGGTDWTIALIAYYDYLQHKVVIEDEVVIKEKPNSKIIAAELQRKMTEHWGEKPPYLMYADNNNQILLNDLQLFHNLNFIPTRKDNKEAAVNNVKLKIALRELIIHPRCKTLISHIKNAGWKKLTAGNYREFRRGRDGSHYDAADALIYLIRNIVYSKNPFPSHYNSLSLENRHVRPTQDSDSGWNKVAKIFKGKFNK